MPGERDREPAVAQASAGYGGGRFPNISGAQVFVDQRSAALEEAGDLLTPIRDGVITPEHIRAELGELLTGQAQGRSDATQITLFKSVGLAVQDLFATIRAFENAQQLGLGQQLPR